MLAQKLDLLMKVTHTKNSTFGRALSFDSSYISRIRGGKRGLPKNQPFIAPAAAFFARNLTEPYQRATVAEAVCPGRSWPEDRSEAEALLISWLSRNDSNTDNLIGQLLTCLSAPPSRRLGTLSLPINAENASAEQAVLYFGNSGKREAVEAFLGELCAIGLPQTLLLYSDEDMSWLYEDAAFALRWAGLLTELISKGGRVKIVHTVSRGIGEMLEAVQKWLPLYASGAIESYFYPKLRDGVYRRTLFISKGHSALFSNSIGSHTQEALNILLHDASAVAALEVEFMDYFKLCKPLVQIFNLQNREHFLAKLTEFEETHGNLIMASPAPSHFTIPADVAQSMTVKTGSKRLLQLQRESAARLERALAQGCTVTELLKLPAADAVMAGEVRVPMCDLFGNPSLCYTAPEFKAHIENVIELMRTHEGYRALLSDQIVNEVLLFAKEDVGAIISRCEPTTTVFYMSEQRMTAACLEYLQRIAERAGSGEKTIRQLESYLEKL